MDIRFQHTSFKKLMEKRIRKVLLVSSSYDAFILDEDGNIEDRLFNEYTQLNFSSPPNFYRATNIKEAKEILVSEGIDLVIVMLNIGMDPFLFAKEIKDIKTGTAVVVLTHFSRDVSLRLKSLYVSEADYVFAWMGDIYLILSIIKLIEDSLNVAQDSLLGSQVIIFAEDSIRFSSELLPLLYDIIFKQTIEAAQREGLNAHQRLIRRRGRPKILFTRNASELKEWAQLYKNNLLGIVSDVSFNSGMDTFEGFEVVQALKKNDPHLPVLFCSSDGNNEKKARDLNAGFVQKSKQNWHNDFRFFIYYYFAFGDFIFRNPSSHAEIARATDLFSFKEALNKISDEVLIYHTAHNDISRWLNARALFSIARMLKNLSNDDFNHHAGTIREFLLEAIAQYRGSATKGLIVSEEGGHFDKDILFIKTGKDSIGGKARGLAFLDQLVDKYQLMNKYPNVKITIPRTIAISTSYFNEFIENNHLSKYYVSNTKDEDILNAFLKAHLPASLVIQLRKLVSVIHQPVAVRSSSKLEDSYYQPFAGIYNTYFVPHQENKDSFLLHISMAIKAVYASAFFNSAQSYLTSTAHYLENEKMGIVIQEVCGDVCNGMFFPVVSGVARSINYYPLDGQMPDEGMVSMAYGMGKYVVDGHKTLMFSPKHSDNMIQWSDAALSLSASQTQFFALDLSIPFSPTTDDSFNLKLCSIRDLPEAFFHPLLFSVFDALNQQIRHSVKYEGKKILTFYGLLHNEALAFSKIISDLLYHAGKDMNNPVEIEFAFQLPKDENDKAYFYILQIRPMVYNYLKGDAGIFDHLEDAFVFSNLALGTGEYNDIYDVLIVDPLCFNTLNTHEIAIEIDLLNKQLEKESKEYLLIGPGRWGSADSSLGIPVSWHQISGASIIVETALEQFMPEPSQGTHFFQNLNAFRVGYLYVNPFQNKGILDYNKLPETNLLFKGKYIKHYRFKDSIQAIIDGRSRKGYIKITSC